MKTNARNGIVKIYQVRDLMASIAILSISSMIKSIKTKVEPTMIPSPLAHLANREGKI